MMAEYRCRLCVESVSSACSDIRSRTGAGTDSKQSELLARRPYREGCVKEKRGQLAYL
jgi:hypothetical protein